MPASSHMTSVQVFLRAIGDTRRPLVYLFHSWCIINVCLNLFFVTVFRPWCGRSCPLRQSSPNTHLQFLLRCMMKSDSSYVVNQSLRINKQKLKQIIRIGLPQVCKGRISISQTYLYNLDKLFFDPLQWLGILWHPTLRDLSIHR